MPGSLPAIVQTLVLLGYSLGREALGNQERILAKGSRVLKDIEDRLRQRSGVPRQVIEGGIERVRARVEEGDSLSKALADTGVFPEMLVQMVATGEETGQLDRMLSRTADYYEQRVTTQVDGLSSLVEPIAVLVLAGIVGFMLLALYLPIFNLGQAMRSGLMGQ